MGAALHPPPLSTCCACCLVQVAAEGAKADLQEAMPALCAAIDSLKALNKQDITEIKSFPKPPSLVQVGLRGAKQNGLDPALVQVSSRGTQQESIGPGLVQVVLRGFQHECIWRPLQGLPRAVGSGGTSQRVCPLPGEVPHWNPDFWLEVQGRGVFLLPRPLATAMAPAGICEIAACRKAIDAEVCCT